jgi:hypothetical protein
MPSARTGAVAKIAPANASAVRIEIFFNMSTPFSCYVGENGANRPPPLGDN